MSTKQNIKVRLTQLIARCTSRARQPLKSATPTTSPSAHQWHPMPGRRIEYGTTGWQIRMEVVMTADAQVVFYAAINPEGITVSTTQHDLQRLKRTVEEFAHNREEFSQ